MDSNEGTVKYIVHFIYSCLGQQSVCKPLKSLKCCLININIATKSVELSEDMKTPEREGLLL